MSAIIAAAVFVLMLLLWYKPPLFSAVGGQQVLLILLGVDVSLGPLITLIIFDPQKSRKALTFDLAVICILQISALIYGVNVVFQARPAFIVFSKNSFDLVTANMLSKEDIARARYPNYRSLPLTGPLYVYSELPTNLKERYEVVLGAFSGKDLPQFPQYYMPYADHMAAAGRAAKSIAELKKLNPNRTAEIDNAVRSSGQTEAELGFVPLRAKYQDQVVVLKKKDGKVLEMLQMHPW